MASKAYLKLYLPNQVLLLTMFDDMISNYDHTMCKAAHVPNSFSLSPIIIPFQLAVPLGRQANKGRASELFSCSQSTLQES